MRNSRWDSERDGVALPQDEGREAMRADEELPIIDLTLLPAAPRPVAPVRDMQHWIDLCG